MRLLSILLQTGTSGTSGFSASTLIMIVALFAIMYLFMIRPQQKKQKEIQKMRESLKVGDRIITAGGVHGKIKEVDDATFTVEIAENTRIKIDKASVFAAGDGTQARK